MTLVESLLFKTSHDILVAPTILEDFLALPDHQERKIVVYPFVLSCTEEEEQSCFGQTRDDRREGARRRSCDNGFAKAASGALGERHMLATYCSAQLPG